MANELLISPAQRPQYAANVDLSPNVAEPEYVPARRNAARVGAEHPSPVARPQQSAGPVGVVDLAKADGVRRLRRWTDL